MINRARLAAAGLPVLAVLVPLSAAAQAREPLIGQSEQVYVCCEDNTDVRGLAFDDHAAKAGRLFVLDGTARVFIYGLPPEPSAQADGLELLQTLDLSLVTGSAPLASPRGLAWAVEDGREVLYFLDWSGSRGTPASRLWRYDLAGGAASSVDLSLHAFRIGEREALDLAYDQGDLLVSFDAAGYAEPSLRAQRGLLRIAWQDAFGEEPASVCHLPDSGTAPSRGLACMTWDGGRYLWATVGNDQIYCAEGRTGRGLFFFDRPNSAENSVSCWGLCCGQGALWVSENLPGSARVHRVNVTSNPDACYEGPRILRRLLMTISSAPAAESETPGAVYHYYSRPYQYEQLGNQGIWLETESIVDVSNAPNATIQLLTHDPAGDVASRQFVPCVQYASAPSRAYASRYEIDLWTGACKKFVYPHRANRSCDALAGTDYLADDRELYNLSDAATYAAFVERVRAHIERKYDVPADLENPYWAARNVVEYIQDNYYYPSRPKRRPATVDYDRQHYDANPANRKIELSARPYDKTQIIACSGTSVMVAGALRYLGIPARWLGSGTQMTAGNWDTDGDGLLEADETADCTNGHRYTQVWLGNHYGWICFDATPSMPDLQDYDVPPPLQSQQRYMTRCAGGHRDERRIVFNVGSGLYRPLYRDFQYDPQLAVDNNCGGDQRYNLQGRYEAAENWQRPRHGIRVKNLCFLEDIQVGGPAEETRISWRPVGPWQRIDGATLSVYLQQLTGNGNGARDLACVARAVPYEAEQLAVDLSAWHGQQFRILLRRDGDPETGGHSQPFVLE
jgi:hypothetical protein